MRKKMLLALLAIPFLAGGVALAMSAGASVVPAQPADDYICPVTGEVLPCPDCCPYARK